MAGYTIEDIDIIRRKSGISYQEAVALLEYHNGNLAQALIDLERNGKLKKEEPRARKERGGFVSLLHTLYRMRIRIRRDDVSIINFSVLYCAACVIFAPYLTVISAILALVLGYRFSFIRHDASFDKTDLEETFHHAADNVKSTLGDMAKGFSGSFAGQGSESKGREQEEKRPVGDSFFATRPSASSASRSAAEPRRVSSQDGEVRFVQDRDGYSSATIE